MGLRSKVVTYFLLVLVTLNFTIEVSADILKHHHLKIPDHTPETPLQWLRNRNVTLSANLSATGGLGAVLTHADGTTEDLGKLD